MMQDPFIAKLVSRDARDFARNRKIKNQASKEEQTMAITEKTIEEIRKDFDKHNEQVLKIYRRNGDKSLLELLYLNSDNPEEVAEEFVFHPTMLNPLLVIVGDVTLQDELLFHIVQLSLAEELVAPLPLNVIVTPLEVIA